MGAESRFRSCEEHSHRTRMSQAELITAGAKSPPPTNTPARVGVSLRRAIRPRERHIVASKDGAVTGYWDVPKELVSARRDGGAI